MKKISTLILGFSALSLYAQTPPDIDALEDIIVETYYISNEGDSDGGILPVGSYTYRIFADLKPGYSVQINGGDPNHPMEINTQGVLFNSSFGSTTGSDFLPALVNFNTAILDSYLAIGGATQAHFGIPKSLDPDGSILTGTGGFLSNDAVEISPLQSDGLIPGTPPSVGLLGFSEASNYFGLASSPDGSLFVNNGSWFVLEGVTGPTEDNIVLLAQVTTTVCDLSFKLNLQINIPDSLQTDQRNTIQFRAETHPADAAINASNDTYIIYQKDILNFNNEEECLVNVDDIKDFSNAWQLAPNPSSGIFHINFSKEMQTVNYRIFNSKGQTVYSGLMRSAIGRSEEIDLSGFAPGIYLVQLETEGVFSTKKLVKH